MSLSSLLLFAGVYFVAVASPGPAIAALVARVLGSGVKGVTPFIAGFVVGDMVWLILAGTGLSVLANAFAGVFVALKYAGAAYLLFVAWKMATASAATGEAAPSASRGWRALFGSISLSLSNPKSMIFYLSIMPLVVDVRTLTPLALAELAVVCSLILSSTFTAFVLAANRARALLRSARAMRFANRTAGGVMAGAAVVIATR